MFEIRSSGVFNRWLSRLRDRQARMRVSVRIRRLAFGNAGDTKPVGSGVFELRVDFGPGYRVYYMQRGEKVVVLLCGGDKSSQTSDIERAQQIAATWTDEDEEDEDSE